MSSMYRKVFQKSELKNDEIKPYLPLLKKILKRTLHNFLAAVLQAGKKIKKRN